MDDEAHDMEEASMTDYEFFKSRGVCPVCRAAVPAPGRVACEDCLAAERIRNAKRRAALTEEQRAAHAARSRQVKARTRARRKAAGLCLDCWKPAEPGRVLCLECKARRKERVQRKATVDS